MAVNDKLRVELCMGSSCFARGNSSTLSDLEGYISENGLEDRVELEGHLCLGKCNSGPHIMIGDKEFSGISDSSCVIDLVRKALEEIDAESDLH